MKQVKMTKTKKQKTTLKQKSMKKSTTKTRSSLGPKASGSTPTKPGAAFHPHQDAMEHAIDTINKIQRLYLEGPENTNARYMLVQVDRNVPDPGRQLIEALKSAGVDWVSTVYTDPGYIKTKVQNL